MSIDRQTIRNILTGTDLSILEEEIARQAGQYVNRDHFDFAIDLILRDVMNSGLELEAIIQTITDEKEKFINFGVQLLFAIGTKADDKPEEEYPVGEEPDESEKNTVLGSYGIGVGFGIQYAIYYQFLTANQIDQLTNYVKKSRIPHAIKFSRQLQNIFKMK